MAKRAVLDASIAIKWFLRDSLETNIDKAERILLLLLNGDLELHAPRIFTYEVCGAMAKACAHRLAGNKAPRMTMEFAVRCVKELFQLPIQVEGSDEQEAIEALELAVTYGKGHYDMTYLSLARKMNCEWLTADEKVLLAAPAGFPTKQIVLLSSFT